VSFLESSTYLLAESGFDVLGSKPEIEPALVSDMSETPPTSFADCIVCACSVDGLSCAHAKLDIMSAARMDNIRIVVMSVRSSKRFEHGLDAGRGLPQSE
jgi:hypothetical protein